MIPLSGLTLHYCVPVPSHDLDFHRYVTSSFLCSLIEVRFSCPLCYIFGKLLTGTAFPMNDFPECTLRTLLDIYVSHHLSFLCLYYFCFLPEYYVPNVVSVSVSINDCPFGFPFYTS